MYRVTSFDSFENDVGWSGIRFVYRQHANICLSSCIVSNLITCYSMFVSCQLGFVHDSKKQSCLTINDTRNSKFSRKAHHQSIYDWFTHISWSASPLKRILWWLYEHSDVFCYKYCMDCVGCFMGIPDTVTMTSPMFVDSHVCRYPVVKMYMIQW